MNSPSAGLAPAAPPASPVRRSRARPRFGARRPTITTAPTVGAYLIAWLAGRQTLRPSTRRTYETHLRRYLIPHLGDVPLPSLTLDMVQTMYTAIAAQQPEHGRPIGPATVRRVHATLMTALGAAVRRGLLERNPASFVELPHAPQPRMTVWTPGQLAGFLASAGSDRLSALFLLLAFTGLRRGEAIGLRWIDVDLDRAVLRVEQQIVAVGGEEHTGPPKSARGRRSVALPVPLVQALAAHEQRQHFEQHLAGTTWVDSGLVFTTPTGAALTPGNVSRLFDRLVARSGQPTIRLHDLRHTSASLGLDSGESLLEVSRRLGHSSITITADVYSHIAPATARKSAQRLADLITLGTRTGT